MRWTVLVFAVGCGRVDFAARQDGAAGDAVADAACTFGAWSTPRPLAGPIQSPVDDWGAAPALGGKALFLYSFRITTDSNLWVATRGSTADDFGAAVELDQIATTASERGVGVSDDALALIWSVDVGATHQLRESLRSSTTVMFMSTDDPGLGVAGTDDDDPWLSADGKRLVFSSDRGGPHEIYETTRSDRGAAFAPPQRVLASSGTPLHAPSLSADGLDIYFVIGNDGTLDIFTAHRTAVDQPFSASVPVSELNTARDDTFPRVSLDGLTMYLNYDAFVAGGENADLYVATRACL